ncbi:DUF3093 domain-containing protein [Curtobacterium sp. MCJR17_043]|uniref:DUF3093 domain-containing protein n=1 Tax=Curtobacterium sp. MCJR17_043 TaxID=2175660 RepID=UPI0024E03BFE|nr:DUF3093 domain-containing protein [Curtobacterium sp. MCJR17_043]WIB34887.1 DUF3093 domain-containing protein [Curtobacterium sp. MCJR17_043]
MTETEFRAGRAHLPRTAVGAVEGFTGAAATSQRGPQLDARAWTLFRGYVHGVVKVEVRDDADPTPYWLVSVRHPDAVTRALTGSAATPRQRPALTPRRGGASSPTQDLPTRRTS